MLDAQRGGAAEPGLAVPFKVDNFQEGKGVKDCKTTKQTKEEGG